MGDTNHCFIIADANQKIGTGHVMRCAILARLLQSKGIQVTYVVADTAPFMQQWIVEHGFGLQVLTHAQRDDTATLIQSLQVQSSEKHILLFDSDRNAFYAPAYQQTLRQAGWGLTMITFHNPEAFYVHILHNQNPLAFDTVYQTPLSTQKLLGLEYVILKPEYTRLYEQSSVKSVARLSTIMLTFGGSDQWDLTRRILGLLEQVTMDQPLNIIVVVGALYQHTSALDALAKSSRHQIEIFVNTPEMPNLMYRADMAITSGGLTVWELACCKTVNFVIPTSIREINTAKRLQSEDLIHFIGSLENISDEAIIKQIEQMLQSTAKHQEMVDRFYKKINPRGAQRVVEAMEKLLVTL